MIVCDICGKATDQSPLSHISVNSVGTLDFKIDLCKEHDKLVREIAPNFANLFAAMIRNLSNQEKK